MKDYGKQKSREKSYKPLTRLQQKQILENKWVFETLSRKYAPQLPAGSALDRSDLEQSAYFGACRAIHRFDPAKGTTLSSFLYVACSGAIKQTIRDQSRTVRLPRVATENRGTVFRLVKCQGFSPREAAEWLNQNRVGGRTTWDEVAVAEVLASFKEENRPIDNTEDDSRRPFSVESKNNWLQDLCYEYQLNPDDVVSFLSSKELTPLIHPDRPLPVDLIRNLFESHIDGSTQLPTPAPSQSVVKNSQSDKSQFETGSD